VVWDETGFSATKKKIRSNTFPLNSFLIKVFICQHGFFISISILMPQHSPRFIPVGDYYGQILPKSPEILFRDSLKADGWQGTEFA